MKTLAHLAGDVREDEVAVVELHPEHGPGENGVDRAFQFYGFVVLHNRWKAALSRNSQNLEANSLSKSRQIGILRR